MQAAAAADAAITIAQPHSQPKTQVTHHFCPLQEAPQASTVTYGHRCLDEAPTVGPRTVGATRCCQ